MSTMSTVETAALGRLEADPEPRARRRALFGPHRSTVVQYLVWIATVVLVVGPLVPVVWASLWTTPLYDDGGALTLQNYRNLLTDSAWWTAVRNTVLFAVITTAASIVIGTAMSVLLNRVAVPAGRLFRVLILAPVVLPGLPLMLGWITMYSE